MVKYFIVYEFKSAQATGKGCVTKEFSAKKTTDEIAESLKEDYHYTNVKLIEAIETSTIK